MNFASAEFWTILALCYLGSRIVLFAISKFAPSRESTIAKLCLLITALTLMTAESWLTLGAFVWVILFGWVAVHTNLIRAPWRNPAFLILLIFQLAPLFYYKYWNFFFNDVLHLDWRIPSVLIPMGLSFYTFQTLAFWIDSRKQESPLPNFLDYFNFCSFFPQIVAGPIERKNDLLPQIQQARFRLDLNALDPALRWIVLGLAYKLIVADNLGNLAPLLRIDPANAWHVWFECLVFGFRIYFDFAGYSFIAVGLGLLFGVKLTLNFLSPYWSADLREFWRRWHVSLGGWLRDYVYLPLGGRKRRWILNTLIVFVVSGIWHGAGWGFLAWGLMHGIGIILCKSKQTPVFPNWVSIPTTYLFVNITWLPFFEHDTASLKEKSFSLINPSSYFTQLNSQKMFSQTSELAGCSLVLLIAVGLLLAERNWGSNYGSPYQLLRTTPATLAATAGIVILAPAGPSAFIYFHF
jgi:D-alanyl-lipoteichoic acid acyltransferase DltB (MBOAT superfamily)